MATGEGGNPQNQGDINQWPSRDNSCGRFAANEQGLTEIAAPTPASPTETENDLSREQSKAKENGRAEFEGNEAGLTELAAPCPVAQVERTVVLEDKEVHPQGGGDLENVSPVATAPSRSNQEVVPAEGFSEDEESAPLPWARTATWAEAVTVSWLILFSFFGTLARLGVEALTTYPSAPFASTVLWANLGGSLFLGFLLEDRRLFRGMVPTDLITDDKEATHGHIARQQKTLPIYIGLATGFCGSFTSFSSFITDAFLALANRLTPSSPTSPYHNVPVTSIHARNGGYSFLAVLSILIVHPAVSIGALKTGAHVALATGRFTPSIPAKLITWLDRVVVVLGLGCWIGVVLLSVFPPGPASAWRFRATLPLVFSPPGALLRFYLSKYLNPRLPPFPMGTFTANIIGTVVQATCYVLQHSDSVVTKGESVDADACTVLEGLMQGFCGCLTTVSTWVAELNGLRRRHAWFYGLTSVAVALAFQVVIMGTVLWTKGFVDSCEAFQ